jgi:hypothetical protein
VHFAPVDQIIENQLAKTWSSLGVVLSDTFLAESYFGEYTPASSVIYNASGLLHKTKKFTDGKYLHLVSGTQDSRFPLVHTMLFSKVLTAADVMFSQRVSSLQFFVLCDGDDGLHFLRELFAVTPSDTVLRVK